MPETAAAATTTPAIAGSSFGQTRPLSASWEGSPLRLFTRLDRTSTCQPSTAAFHPKPKFKLRRYRRRIELALDVPTEAGETKIRLWSNLPGKVDAGRIAELYRTRWRIDIDQA